MHQCICFTCILRDRRLAIGALENTHSINGGSIGVFQTIRLVNYIITIAVGITVGKQNHHTGSVCAIAVFQNILRHGQAVQCLCATAGRQSTYRIGYAGASGLQFHAL